MTRLKQTGKPLVSVIIPVHNVTPYLKESLDSVIGQTYQNLEILVIDDGSTDGSGELCDEYAARDPRIQVIHQENLGLGSARNAGLDLMTGSYVAFLDSDDYLHPEMIWKTTAALEKTGADIVAFRKRKTDNSVDHDLPEGVISSGRALELLCACRLGFAVWSKVYRREVWNGIRFTEHRYFEDAGITPRLLDRAESIALLNEELIMYRIRPGSILRTFSPGVEEDWRWAAEEFLAFFDENTPEKFSEELRRSAHECILRKTVSRYMLLVSVGSAENAVAREQIREEINWLMSGTPVRFLPLRAACFLIRRSPSLIPLAWRVYWGTVQRWRHTGRKERQEKIDWTAYRKQYNP